MSIVPEVEPEVPYEEDSDEGEPDINWRDPQILPDQNALRLAQQRDLDNLKFHAARQSEGPDQMPDDCWMLPPEYSLLDVLGKKRSRLEAIRHDTSTSLRYNESKHQVDIWGEKSAVQQAKHHLNLIVTRLNEHADATRRRTKKWGRPERELTVKEKKRVDRQQARQAEERLYRGEPDGPQPYHAIVPLPSDDLPLSKLLGVKDAYINQMRAECKCWMWLDRKMTYSVRIAGQEEDRVATAAARMRNWFLRNVRSPYRATMYLMKQPRNYMLVKFIKLPQGFVTFAHTGDEIQQIMLTKHRLLESINIGRYDESHLNPAGTSGSGSATASATVNLIDLDDSGISSAATAKGDDTSSNLPESLQRLDEENEARIRHALQYSLESIRLFDWEIRMKIRFGQICLINYPPVDDTIKVDKLALKTFNKAKFNAALAPCIGRTMDDMKRLFEYLNQHATEFHDSPRTTFTIQADQYATFTPKPANNSRSRREVTATPLRGDDPRFNTVTICKFTGEQRVGLWNTLTERADLVTATCADLESEYSWDLKLQTARRLMNTDSPHGKFVDGLKLNPSSGRLSLLANTPDYTPLIVTQKTKWIYEYGERWIIEVARDELWDLTQPPVPEPPKQADDLTELERMPILDRHRELPADLTEYRPHRVLFKVSAYREDWVDRFAENLTLSLGEAPRWTPRDFLASDTEDVAKIMAMAHKITDILSREVPQYWSTLM